MKRRLAGAGAGGLVIIGIAAYLIVAEIFFINKCELVKAKITNIEFHNESKNNEDDNDYYILKMKILSSNKPIRINFDTGFHDPKFTEGQIIDVYYNSKAPDKSEVKDIWNQWGGALICMGVFVFDFWIFIGLLASFKKQKSDL